MQAWSISPLDASVAPGGSFYYLEEGVHETSRGNNREGEA